MRVDVSASAPGKARALLTHSRQPLPFPLPLEPLVAKPTFFEKREGFNWSGMLMNPMVLMMGVTVRGATHAMRTHIVREETWTADVALGDGGVCVCRCSSCSSFRR